MRNWQNFNIHEQVEIVVMFIRDKRDDLSLAEQCSLEHFLYKYAKKPTYVKEIEPQLTSLKQLDDWLVQDGLEEWFNDNLDSFQDLEISEFPNVDFIFWKEGWLVSHDGFDYVVERIDDVVAWKEDNNLDFLPTQLESDLEAVKLAKKYGFEFGYGYKQTRITKPCFAN